MPGPLSTPWAEWVVNAVGLAPTPLLLNTHLILGLEVINNFMERCGYALPWVKGSIPLRELKHPSDGYVRNSPHSQVLFDRAGLRLPHNKFVDRLESSRVANSTTTLLV